MGSEEEDDAVFQVNENHCEHQEHQGWVLFEKTKY